MKKLLALLAVLGMVNVASAAVTFSFVKGETTPVYPLSTGEMVSYDTYYICADVTNNTEQFNALDLTVVSGDNNIGVLTGGTYVDSNDKTQRVFMFDAMTQAVGRPPVTFLVADPGHSSLDLKGDIALVGTIYQADHDPGADGYYLVQSVTMAFAQSGPFATKFNTAGVQGATAENQLATIYLKSGTTATATLCGSAGGLTGEVVTVGVVALPEPATLSILAIGALGLIRRKLA